MSTLEDDLKKAQDENSPSTAAAVKAALDKQEPQPVPEPEAPLAEFDSEAGEA